MMRERASFIVGALAVLLLALPLGYLLHVSARFPGSLAGSLIGVAGALLMLIALAYPLAKRVPWIHDRLTPKVSLPSLLALHVYTGVLGPILGVVHSAHKFTSPLGIALVASMLVVVLSGYVGRFYLGRVAKGVRGRSGELGELQRTLAALGLGGESKEDMREGVALAVADMESAVRTERAVQQLLQRWLYLHIIVGVLLYVLLTLHIWAGLYFGLRWL